MKIDYTGWRPTQQKVHDLLGAAMTVTEQYAAMGYQITLRQLYYQLVSSRVIRNHQNDYQRLSKTVRLGKEGGFIDWDHLIDRSRSLLKHPQWDSARDLLEQAALGFRVDRWLGQDRYVELWCEKDALASVLEPMTEAQHIAFMSQKGYSSSTALYEGANRFRRAYQKGQIPTVIYLGDHDPSGLQMTFDIENRLEMLSGGDIDLEVVRLALNHDQIEDYQLLPNPVKLKDPRAGDYVDIYGHECWELDALPPEVLAGMIQTAVSTFRDPDIYAEQLAYEQEQIQLLVSYATKLSNPDDNSWPLWRD